MLAIAEAALTGIRPTTKTMREATGLSTGSCVNALRVLTDLGLLEAAAQRGRGSARKVGDARRLLDAYADAATGLVDSAAVEFGVTWRDIEAGLRDLESAWARAGVSYAVTGTTAANLLAPYLTTVNVAEVYVTAGSLLDLEAAGTAAKLKPIEGGRLALRPFPTAAVDRLASSTGGLRLAPWPRVYVDLLHAGVRGEDAAEYLAEEMLS